MSEALLHLKFGEPTGSDRRVLEPFDGYDSILDELTINELALADSQGNDRGFLIPEVGLHLDEMMSRNDIPSIRFGKILSNLRELPTDYNLPLNFFPEKLIDRQTLTQLGSGQGVDKVSIEQVGEIECFLLLQNYFDAFLRQYTTIWDLGSRSLLALQFVQKYKYQPLIDSLNAYQHYRVGAA